MIWGLVKAAVATVAAVVVDAMRVPCWFIFMNIPQSDTADKRGTLSKDTKNGVTGFLGHYGISRLFSLIIPCVFLLGPTFTNWHTLTQTTGCWHGWSQTELYCPDRWRFRLLPAYSEMYSAATYRQNHSTFYSAFFAEIVCFCEWTFSLNELVWFHWMNSYDLIECYSLIWMSRTLSPVLLTDYDD